MSDTSDHPERSVTEGGTGTHQRATLGEHVGAFLDFVLACEPLEWLSPITMGALAVGVRLYYAHLRLDGFDDRIMGMAVQHLVDVPGRTKLMLECVAILAGAVVGVFALAWGIARRLSPRTSRRLRRALRPAHVLLALALLPPLALPWGMEVVRASRLALNAAAVAALLALVRAFPRLGGVPRLRPSALIALTLAAWSSAYAFVVEFQHRPNLSNALLLYGWLATLLAVTLVPRLASWQQSVSSGAETSRRLRCGALPLLAMPFAGFVAQEAGYAVVLRGGASVSFGVLHLSVLVALAALGVAFTILPARRHWRVGRWHLPLAVAALGFVDSWTPAGTSIHYDLFHYGETALPAHQLFRFGSLPYVDVLPTHGLVMSYLGGALHFLLDGFVSGDSVLLGWPILAAVGCAALFAYARRVSGSALLAGLVVAMLPTAGDRDLATGYHAGFLVLLALGDAVSNGRRRRFHALGVALLAAMLYRIDLGVSMLVVSGGILAAYLLWRGRESLRRALGDAILPAVLPTTVAILALSSFAFLFRPDGLQTVGVVGQYLSLTFQGLSTGNVPFFNPSIPRSVSHVTHFLLMGTSVVAGLALGLSALRQRRLGADWSRRDVLLVSAICFNVLVYSRAFGRHTEAEIGVGGYVGAYTMVLLLLVAHRLLGARRPAFTGTVASLMLLQILLLPGNASLVSRALAARPFLAEERPRVMGPFSPRYPQSEGLNARLATIRAFADKWLNPRETFFDLSNEPLLYVALDRRFPGYVVPMLYTVSERTQRQLLVRMARARVGFAILRDSKWWRALDGIDDGVRSYRVHESLLERFPVAVPVATYTVLLDARMASQPGVPAPLSPAQRVEFFELGAIPWLWANRDPLLTLEKSSVASDLMPALRRALGAPAPDSVSISGRGRSRVAIGSLETAPGQYLHLRVRSSSDGAPFASRSDRALPNGEGGSLTIRYYKSSDEPPSGFTFDLRAGEANYLIRPGGQQAWLGDPRPVVLFEIDNRSASPVDVLQFDVRRGE